jgi:hypothetical protein
VLVGGIESEQLAVVGRVADVQNEVVSEPLDTEAVLPVGEAERRNFGSERRLGRNEQRAADESRDRYCCFSDMAAQKGDTHNDPSMGDVAVICARAPGRASHSVFSDVLRVFLYRLNGMCQWLGRAQPTPHSDG